MYQNTPSSAYYSPRPDASQGPSTPTHAPRMGARGLPPSPHNPLPPMTPRSAGFAPYQHYGLMTPPDSPDTIATRSLDFHKLLDARGPPLVFDIRQGMHLSGDAAMERAINHPANRMLVSIGPNIFNVEIAASNGSTITLSDVYGQLAYALSMRAGMNEVAAAIQAGLASPHCSPANCTRAGIMSLKFIFAGLTLRIVQNGVAFVDCHLRSAM